MTCPCQGKGRTGFPSTPRHPAAAAAPGEGRLEGLLTAAGLGSKDPASTSWAHHGVRCPHTTHARSHLPATLWAQRDSPPTGSGEVWAPDTVDRALNLGIIPSPSPSLSHSLALTLAVGLAPALTLNLTLTLTLALTLTPALGLGLAQA